MDNKEISQDRFGLTELKESVEKLKTEAAKVIVGQEKMIELMIVSIFANGHVLLEGVPGIAKTLTAKLLAKMMSVNFNRIQFTPDLMPSDVTGSTIFNTGKGKFEFNKGPIFSSIVLIDEINRAPAKTQSALFEVMEERQVTVDGNTYPLESPFLVFATQNPLEHEGTYRLPEAQLDRFLFKINIGYPNLDEEFKILVNTQERKESRELDNITKVLSANEIIKYQKQVLHIHVDENLMKYISEIINKTRNHPSLYLGASPRASINTLNASKALAAIRGRDYVIPEDIKNILPPVLIHRIYLTPEKEMEGGTEEQTVKDIINSVEVPR